MFTTLWRFGALVLAAYGFYNAMKAFMASPYGETVKDKALETSKDVKKFAKSYMGGKK